MSWYSDGEKFDEYDPPWCKNCDGGESKEECDKCCARRMEEEEEYDDEEDEEGERCIYTNHI